MLQGNDLDGCTTEERGSGGSIEEKERRKEMGKEKNDEYEGKKNLYYLVVFNCQYFIPLMTFTLDEHRMIILNKFKNIKY